MRFLKRGAGVLFFAVLGTFLSSLVSHAATYYVSPNGNDSNDGLSTASAWAGVKKVNSVNFAAGDRILFEGGRIFGGNLYFNASDRGSAENPIVIGSYGAGRATINNGNGDGFYAYNTAGISLKHLNFVGSGAEINTKDGISFYTDLPGNLKLAGVTIDSVTVSGFGNCGVHIGSWNNQTGYRDVRIINVIAHDNLHAGIATYAQAPRVHSNVYVTQSCAFNNFGNPRSMKNTGSGIVLGGVTGAKIERCVAYNNGKNNLAPTEGPVGIWTYHSDRVTIQHNESYGNRTGSAKDGGGFDLDIDVQNSVMQYNYSHENDGAGYLLCDGASNSGNVIRYNISQNDGRKNGFAAIHTYGNIHNAEIYNNSVYVSQADGGPRAVLLMGGTTNLRFRNNIFYSSGGARLIEIQGTHSGLMFQGNCYFGENESSIVQAGAMYPGLASWRSATGQEKLNGASVGVQVDPQLTQAGSGGTLNNANALSTLSAYKLKSSSPLINHGVNLGALGVQPGPKDFYGTTIAQGSGYEIGAHEMVAASNGGVIEPTPPATKPDLTGKPQVFFQHADRRIAFWGMQDTQYLGAELMRNGVALGGDWRFVSAGDVTGDGSADLVFQHRAGQVAIWKMQGSEFVGAMQLRSGATPGSGWRAVTAADFNGDSHKDILFQDNAGKMRVWFLEGTKFLRGVTLAKSAGAGWSAFGAGDFDGDGSRDILFRHSDGRLMTWLMNGVTFTRSQVLRHMKANNGWTLAALVDLDQNGHVDLLWQHNDGRLAVWKFNRTAFVSSSFLRNGQKAGPGWRAIGPR